MHALIRRRCMHYALACTQCACMGVEGGLFSINECLNVADGPSLVFLSFYEN
jgi:hypothetical protein